MPLKRSRYKIETKESKALKRMRQAAGLSLVKAEKQTGIHSTILNHAENGRRNLDVNFIEKYVTALGFTMEEWEEFLNKDKTVYDIKEECIELVKQMNKKQLKMMKVFLSGIMMED